MGPQPIHGFGARFRHTVEEEFFHTVWRTKTCLEVAQWQKDLNARCQYYKYERPHPGYRNMGKRPMDTLTQCLKSVRKEAQGYIYVTIGFESLKLDSVCVMK